MGFTLLVSVVLYSKRTGAKSELQMLLEKHASNKDLEVIKGPVPYHLLFLTSIRTKCARFHTTSRLKPNSHSVQMMFIAL